MANEKAPTVNSKLNDQAKNVLQIYAILVCLFFFIVTILVHVCQYRVFNGGFLMSSGANEVWSLIVILVVTWLYKQQEVTQEEIEDKMARFEAQLHSNRSGGNEI